jgi:hypothetical protein
VGVVAHRGGLLVRRPELTVGVVQAVSRPSGLWIELIARRPLDTRSATQRQREIRTRRVTGAPRVLLPEFDEGEDLRLGWFDAAGKVRWEFPRSRLSSSGDSHLGVDGPSYRLGYQLPALFDAVSIVLAWPEIGFPESVIALPLPDRDAVAAGTASIWAAPVETLPVPGLAYRAAPRHDPVPVETGAVVAAPRVLHRGEHAVVALTRLTAVGSALCMEVLGVSRADRSARPRIALIAGHDAGWLTAQGATSSGGPDGHTSRQEFTFDGPAGDVLDLLVSWPGAGLADARVLVARQVA